MNPNPGRPMRLAPQPLGTNAPVNPPQSPEGPPPVSVIQPAIRAEHVTRTLTSDVPVTLVNDVSLQIERGEFVCIMGPSGSGKSSLLYLLGLLDAPSNGRISVDGQDTSGFDDDAITDFRLAKLGFVFQFHFLLAEFSALENVMLPMRKLGRLNATQARERAWGLLTKLDLQQHAHKQPSQMSGGQRQRVAIARALSNDPLVILADEPTGNLDSSSSANLRDILRDLTRETGKTVVAVTHDARFASAADRRIGIVDGQIALNWQPC